MTGFKASSVAAKFTITLLGCTPTTTCKSPSKLVGLRVISLWLQCNVGTGWWPIITRPVRLSCPKEVPKSTIGAVKALALLERTVDNVGATMSK